MCMAGKLIGEKRTSGTLEGETGKSGKRQSSQKRFILPKTLTFPTADEIAKAAAPITAEETAAIAAAEAAATAAFDAAVARARVTAAKTPLAATANTTCAAAPAKTAPPSEEPELSSTSEEEEPTSTTSEDEELTAGEAGQPAEEEVQAEAPPKLPAPRGKVRLTGPTPSRTSSKLEGRAVGDGTICVAQSCADRKLVLCN